MVMNTSAITL